MRVAYRAGTAYITVTPSFRGFQTRVAAQVKAMRPVDVPAVLDLRDIRVPGTRVRVGASLDPGAAARVAAELRAALAALPDVTVDADTTPAGRRVAQLRAELQALSGQEVGVEVSTAAATVEINRIRGDLAALAASTPDVQVRADVTAAVARLQALLAEINTSEADVKVHADTTAARREIDSLSGRRILLVAAVSLAPVLGVAAGAAAGGLGGVAAIAAGVLGGAVAAGAVGVAATSQAVAAQKKLVQATKNRAAALNGVRSAEATTAAAVAAADRTALTGARSVADAERALAAARASGAAAVAAAGQVLGDARRNAARVAADTAYQIRQAQQQVAEANRAVVESERQLSVARRQSVADMRALRAQVAADLQAVRAAQLAARDANTAYADVRANIFSTTSDITRARVAAATAETAVQQARARSGQSARDLAAAERDGTPAVLAAQQAVRDAVEQRRAAVTALARTEVDAARARGDAARAVARARAGVAQATAAAAAQESAAVRTLSRARVDAAAADTRATAAVAAARARERYAETRLAAAEAARLRVLRSITPAQRRVLAAIRDLKAAWRGFLLGLDRPLGNMLVTVMGTARAALRPFGLFLRPVLRSLTGVFAMFTRFSSAPVLTRLSRALGRFSGVVLRDAGKGIRNLVVAVGNLLVAFAPLARVMSRGLVGLTRDFRRWTAGLSGSTGFQRFVAWVRRNGPLVVAAVGSITTALVNIGVALAPVGVWMLKAVKWVGDLVARFAASHPVLTRVAAVVGLVGFAVSSAVPVVASLVGVVAALAGTAGIVLGALTIVGGIGVALVVAYQRSEKFRRVVNWLWVALRVGATLIWQRYLRPFLYGFARVLRDEVFPVLRAFWFNVAAPVLRFVGRAVVFLWKYVVLPVFTAWRWYLTRVLFPVLRSLWVNVVRPVFTAVGGTVRFLWKYVVLPVFTAWRWYLTRVLFPVLRSLWVDVVRPVFTGVGQVITWVWTRVVRPVFTAVAGFVTGTLVSAFRRGVTAIGRIWEGLKALARAPVAFIVNTVYNAGIRRVVNALPGVPDLPEVKFAGGGWTGPGERTRPAGIVHADEFVITKPARRRIETAAPGLLDALNRWGPEALHGPLRGYWLGGGVKPAAGAVTQHTDGYPWARWAGDINEPGTTDLGHPVRAWKAGLVSSTQSLTTSYGKHVRVNHPGSDQRTLYAHMLGYVVRPLQAVNAGQLIGFKGTSGNSTGPHLHFELAGGNDPVGTGGAQGGGGGGGLLSSVWNTVKGLLTGLTGRVSGWVSRLRSTPGWGPMLSKLVSTVGGSVASWVRQRLRGATGVAGTLASGGTSGGWGAVDGGPRAFARNLLGTYGWTTAQFQPLNALWNRESGWRWDARNPTSGAYGIPQALPASKMAVAGGDWRTNPQTQVRWGLGYIKTRYGSPAAAWAHSQQTGWYDRGGVARGPGWLVKGTPHPERVLSPAQTKAFERLVTTQTTPPAGDTTRSNTTRAGRVVFDLRDRDGLLLARLEGVARGVVGGDRDHWAAGQRAGMGFD